MGIYKEIEGNLITLAKEKNFDVISHGCNCFCTMGAGIAPHMAKAFGCDKFPLEDQKYKGDINKLGQIDYGNGWLRGDNGIYGSVVVVNSYTQFNYGRNHLDGDKTPLDYEALTLCMRKINNIFKGKHIGLPKIGAGLAGGIWSIDELSIHDQNTRKDLPEKDIRSIIQTELIDCDVTIVIFNQ